MLEEAISLHREGQFAEAERLYREILREQPQNAQVGHLLGQLGLDAGLPQAAMPVLERVRMLDPGNAQVYNDIGKCLHMTGRPQEAVASFNRALVLEPGLIDAYNNRGLSLHTLGRDHEALDSFEQALALTPDDPGALSNSATALVWLERHDEALARLDAAVEKTPDDAGLYFNRAEVKKLLRRHDAALADYGRALTLEPDFPAPHFNRGLLLARLGRFDDALAALDRALALSPQDARIQVARAMTLARLERFQEGLESCDRAIAAAPDFPDGYVSRCLILAQMDKLDEAIAYGRAAARNPALASDVEFNLALILLQRGQWEEGWRLFEARKTCSVPSETRSYPQPAWLGGESLAGKTLYVYSEHGLGDTIQFCRYLVLAKEAGASVIFSAPEPLVRLVSSLDPDIQVLKQQDVPPQFDFHVPLLSLPLAFAITPERAAPHIPYLHAEPQRAAHRRAAIGPDGFCIGVCWTGDTVTPHFDFGMEQSFDLRRLEAIAALPGVQLISLQKDRDGERSTLPPDMGMQGLGDDFAAGPEGFLDVAAAMQAVDLVITCDAWTAHLAGALGRPVWLALGARADWRWLLERTDCPWYPTMTLFRQPVAGDWGSVFAAMREKLAKMLDA